MHQYFLVHEQLRTSEWLRMRRFPSQHCHPISTRLSGIKHQASFSIQHELQYWHWHLSFLYARIIISKSRRCSGLNSGNHTYDTAQYYRLQKYGAGNALEHLETTIFAKQRAATKGLQRGSRLLYSIIILLVPSQPPWRRDPHGINHVFSFERSRHVLAIPISTSSATVCHNLG